ncbi:hypothetical protein [Leptospira interrogans]|nr:hypothetical protein [Leptospira interrogans]
MHRFYGCSAGVGGNSANTSLNSMYLLWLLCRSVETQQTPP